MDLLDLKIDPEFAEKIPPLTPEEFEQLEANILAEGTVLSPLIVWNGVIVDGHNRYKIIQAHPEISFTTHEKEFADRYEAISWICKNQLGRRNLTPEQRRYLIGKQYEAEKCQHGREAGSPLSRDENGRFTVSPQNGDSRSAGKTSQRIAEETNTSKNYVQRAEIYAQGIEAADESQPGIKQEILSGKLKSPVSAITAIARASPEDRPQMVEDLRKTRPSPKKKRPESTESSAQPEDIETAVETTSEDFHAEEPTSLWTAEGYSTSDRPTSALAISESMASSPDRKNRDTPVETIIAELADALEGMIFRWDFCLTVNQPNASLEECRTQVRALAAKGIEYLNHIKEDK
ncbi:MAG: hypothetical protein IJV14_00080 [Lachnospiraceae bacterium]|nr:hypothetical protein [Lachnospiraceae bacterium]